jgi:hypothetical protein
VLVAEVPMESDGLGHGLAGSESRVRSGCSSLARVFALLCLLRPPPCLVSPIDSLVHGKVDRCEASDIMLLPVNGGLKPS